MTGKYTQATLDLLKGGMAVDAVLTGLQASLRANRHEKLYRKILVEVLRALSGNAGKSEIAITLSKESDEETLRKEIERSLKELGVESGNRSVVIDETIIGGHVVTTKTQRIDRSYKQALLRLYRSVTEKV